MTTTATKNKTTIAVTRTEQVNTQHGQRTIIHCINYGKEIKIYRGANDPYAATLFAGDFIPVIESNGKYELDKEAIANSPKDDRPVRKTKIDILAEKMANCVKAMRSQLPDVSDELIQKYATTIFIESMRK
jgi:hypothetical protein